MDELDVGSENMKIASIFLLLIVSAGCANRRVEIASWRANVSGKPVQVASINAGSFLVTWDPISNGVYSWDFGKSISRFDSQLQRKQTIEADGDIQGFHVSPSGKRLAVSIRRNTIHAVDVYELLPVPKKVATIVAPDDQPHAVFDATERLVFTGGYGVAAHLWNIRTGQLIRTYATNEEEGGMNLDLSPNGKLLAVGNRNGTTHLFDVRSGKRLHRLELGSYWGIGEECGDLIHAVAFSPIGTQLATADVSGRVAIWDYHNGKLITEYHTGGREIFCLAWSPNGKKLAFAGHAKSNDLQKAIRVILLNENQGLIALPGPDRVFDMEFSPDGERLLVGGSKSTDVWKLKR